MANIAAPLLADDVSRIGTAVADFSLKDYRGAEHSLSDFKNSKVVVLAFLGTECPLAKLYGTRLGELDRAYRDRGVTVLGIDSNRQDSITEIAAYARLHKVDFPVLKDLGNHVADQVTAQRTPEVFVLDDSRTVRYHGRVDDQYGVGYIRDAVERNFLKDAIDDLLAGRDVKTPSTEVVGCFIGRVKEPQLDSPVTYSKQIARILQKHCVECHRAGEIAPFALTKYDEVVGWGDTMLEVIADRRMPPWHANPEFGHFRNERSLTDDEKLTLRKWVAAGCPEGDASQLPEPEKFVSGWQLPRKPDLVVEMQDRPYEVPAEGAVKYQYFRVDPKLTEDKWVLAAEAQPGNRAVVHHILVFVRPPKDQRAGLGNTVGEFFAAYVPGYRTPTYPRGMAKFIPAGSELVFQLHYTPIGSPQEDLSRVGIVFADAKDVDHVVVTQQAAQHRFEIPPHADNYQVEANSRQAPSDVQLLAFMPHMHLRGKSFRYEAKFPDGRSQIVLDVPQYDFNWQTAYQLEKPLTLPPGSYLHCTAAYDNSETNLNNPDPTQTVRWGDQTWNEMMIGYFDVAVPLSALGIERVRVGRNAAAETSNEPDPIGSDTFSIGTRQVRISQLVGAIARLDQNGNGKLEKSEVPTQHHFLFNALDGDQDGVLTREEARETIERIRQDRQR
ncbi:redoxin domain-containing protein [bacterium]|nr:redoxin domain-containing protein [bacterium]